MGESQIHGFQFEELVKDWKIKKVLNNISLSYTNNWDVPPISIKSFKYDKNLASNNVEFGSIQRIFSIAEDFIIVLVGYEQENNCKKVVLSDALYISVSTMNILKGSLNINDLNNLNKKLKTFGKGLHQEARLWAKEEKSRVKELSKFDVRFKIDSGSQRRIQCALNLNVLYNTLQRKQIRYSINSIR